MPRSDKKEILEFIKKRFSSTNANWTNGNCYWFAKILTERFPDLIIYYEPTHGHFVAGSRENHVYYDYNGVVKERGIYTPFKIIEEEDPLWFDRLVRDCVL